MAEKKSKSVKKTGAKKPAATKKASEKKPIIFDGVAKVMRAKRGYGRVKLPRGFELVIDGNNITGYVKGQQDNALATTRVRSALFELVKELGIKVRFAS